MRPPGRDDHCSAAASPPAFDPPDVAGFVVGWRTWRFSDRLLAIARGGEWAPGQTAVAQCLFDKDHDGPEADCSCGLYASRDIGTPGRYWNASGPLPPNLPWVIGCVALWGEIVEGSTGWRAERAYPLLLFADESLAAHARREIASAYEVVVHSTSLMGPRVLRAPAVTAAAESVRARLSSMPGLGDSPAEPLSTRIDRWGRADIESLTTAIAENRGLALCDLGDRSREEGRFADARRLYRGVLDSGHVDHVQAAKLGLGDLHAARYAVAKARAAYLEVIDSRHPEHAPAAGLGLGRLLARHGEVAGAREAYQLAIDSDHPHHAADARSALGWLLAQQGDMSGARAAHQHVIDSGHADHAPWALLSLADLLAEHGFVSDARLRYHEVIRSRHATIAPQAMVGLGDLLADQDDADGAEAAYRQAIASGHVDYAMQARHRLGSLLAQQDDLAGARAEWQIVCGSGHPHWAPMAAVELGALFVEKRDVRGAYSAWRQVRSADNPAPIVSTARYLKNSGALRAIVAEFRK